MQMFKILYFPLTAMEEEFSRALRYAWEFYRKRLGLILVFSVPFILAFIVPVLVPAPTYLSMGGLFLRTGSLPELSALDIAITAFAYALAVFVIADTIVNINLIIKSKRTMTTVKSEIVAAMGRYATRIFYIYTLMLLLLFVAQLIFYGNPLQGWLYPLSALILSSLLFFVAPAVVIDESRTADAIRRSVSMAIRNPYLILMWTLSALLCVSFVKVVLDIIFPSPYSAYLTLLVNSLLLLPFFTVLQTHMYMEKYPLAR